MLFKHFNPAIAFNPIPRDYLRWSNLLPVFAKTYPITVSNATLNEEIAPVRYMDHLFFIFPNRSGDCFGGKHYPFSVFGPPHVNQFPDTH
jgi:hypothetical protein